MLSGHTVNKKEGNGNPMEAEKRSMENKNNAGADMNKKIEDPQAEIKGSFTQTNAGRTLTSASGSVVLNVTYDGDVQCDVIEVLDNYKLKLESCKVTGVDSNYSYDEENGATNEGTVTSPSEPGGSNNPTEGQESNVPAPVAFSTDSWATIIKAVKDGNTSAYKVGDTKSITLTSDDTEIAGTYTVRIANMSNTGDVCTEEYYSIVNEDGTKTQTEEKYSKTACGFVIEFVDIITSKGMYDSPSFKDIEGW